MEQRAERCEWNHGFSWGYKNWLLDVVQIELVLCQMDKMPNLGGTGRIVCASRVLSFRGTVHWYLDSALYPLD